MSKRTQFTLLLLFLFLFRLSFGLCQSRWWFKDELQTYLIGLKCYTTGEWPYFGPYVQGNENSFQSRIPGALEGLLIGFPFHFLPIPETPYIVLNLLTTAAIALLAWYICLRLPGLSFPWLVAWIAVVPWSLHEGTHIITPPYLLFPSVLFTIGFMESLPWFSLNRIPPAWSNALMGFALAWAMQFHFSYVYLLPLAAFALGVQFWKGRFSSLPFFVLGFLLLASLAVPTFLKFGLGRGNVASGFAVPFNSYNVSEWVTILARYFSLVCFEVPRFIGDNNQSRFNFLTGHPILTLPGGLLWILGILQPVVLLVCWFKGPSLLPKGKWFPWAAFLAIWIGIYFVIELPLYQVVILAVVFGLMGRVPALASFFSWLKKPHPLPHWKELKLLIFLAYCMVWASFWFTNKGPIAHIYFILFPFIMIYSCYVWSLFLGVPWLRTAAKVFILLGFLFQAGYAVTVAPKDSIYTQRDVVAKAIQEKNFMVLVQQRPDSQY